MTNLKTIYCFKCKHAMEFPYQSNFTEELYHFECLPENEKVIRDEKEIEDANDIMEETKNAISKPE